MRKLGKPERALEAFLDGAVQHPDSAELQIEVGRSYEDLEKSESAAQHYEAALRLKPDLAPAHVALGLIHAESGRLEEAATHLSSAISLDEKSIAAHHSLGIVRERQGDFEAAFSEYARARDLDPNEAKARIGLGSIFDRLGKPVEALKELEEAVRLSPKSIQARYKLATLCFRQGRSDEGDLHLAQMRSLKAQDHSQRADRKLREKDLDGALREFTRALDAEPNHLEAHAKLGALYLRQGDAAKAVEHARRAAELEPKPNRFANLSWALSADGKRDEALEWIDKAIASEPGKSQFEAQRKAILEATPPKPANP